MKKLVFILLLFGTISCSTIKSPIYKTEPTKWAAKTDSLKKAGVYINPLYYSSKRNYW